MALVKFNKNSVPVYTPFNDLFDSFFKESFISDRALAKVPAVNIAEDEDKFTIEVATPGLKREDFKINLDNNVLTISAELKTESSEEENKKITRREFNYGSFSRSFTLPDTADANNISAKYIDGVLYVDLSKKEEAKVLSREIAIS